MTRPSAIDQERDQLDEMIRLLGLDVDGEPIKRESPDFLITLRDGRRIGVEIVRALDEQVASGNGTRSRIKRQTLAALKTAGINAWVNVSLNPNIAGYLNRQPELLRREIAAIVELARQTMAVETEDRWYTFERIDRGYERMMGRRRSRQRDLGDLEGTGIEYATAVGIHPRDEPCVTSSGHGSGQHSNIVQDAIDDKADDLATYRACGADEIWLLVVGSYGTGGSLFVEQVEDVVFTSPYQRTIFLELFEARCIVLNTVAPVASAS